MFGNLSLAGLYGSFVAKTGASTVTYSVPPTVPTAAAVLDRYPIGSSFEFFMWPSYMSNISLALPCLNQFSKLYGKTIPIRIGGTTQDRATFDPNFDGYVSYHVEDPLDAPMELIYGPKYFDLISEFGANTMLEFGRIWKSPLPILCAGGYAVPIPLQPNWPNLKHLITEAYNASVRAATKVYCGHLYALFNSNDMASEMNHFKTVQDVSHFVEKVALAKSVHRQFILGETGFHGLDDPMDSKFGGALQVLDKTLRSVSIGIKRLYYHQGTINQVAFFNWRSNTQIELPFYGSYMAALALDNGDQVVASDEGTDSCAQYIIYRKRKPCKVLLIYTDYYSGQGERTKITFTLTGLSSPKTKGLRMTAPSSEVTATSAKNNKAQAVTIGGQAFSDTTCNLVNKRVLETARVQHGEASFVLAASEALLLYL
ncbi:hypothetical protein HJFPF1_04290 [Paramyrothecium foliicola]|nr:hypothetical protein HJFPF1_04290 [Paramyrothecium foliicola]